MQEMQFRARETIREYRTDKCLITMDGVYWMLRKKSKKRVRVLRSKFKKTNKILFNKWEEKKCVSYASNFNITFSRSSTKIKCK